MTRPAFERYKLFLAWLTLAAAAALVWQCISLYVAGTAPANNPAPGVYTEPIFSPENVGSKLHAIAPLLWGYVAAVLLGLLLRPFPVPEEKTHPARSRMIPPPQNPSAAVRVALLCAAVLLIGFGIMNGGMRDVFIKAINICTECIGLG